MARSSSIKPWHVGLALVALFLLFGTGIGTQLGSVVNTGVGIKTSTTSSNTSGLCSVSKPIQFTVYDGLAGATVNAPTLAIYNGLATVESPSVSASGVATTGNSYVTGQSLILKLSGASLATEYLPFTVPPASCASNAANNVVSVYAVTLGSWTITASASGGTTLTSGNGYYLSQFPAGATGLTTFTVTMSETTNNQGYKTSVDIINGLVTSMVVQVKDTATALSVSGMPHALTVGSTRYWLIGCPDGVSGSGSGTNAGQGAFQQYQVPGQSGGSDSIGASSTNPATGQSLAYGTSGPDSICTGSLSQQKYGTAIYGGGAAFSFQATAGSLASGSSETLAVTMNDYSNINYFLATTSLGPNTAAVGAPQGSSQGTAFNIKLFNA